jgi:two-component system, response regulator PdtaR
MPCRILIAEDEALIRLDLREMVERLGHTVIGEAADGVRALRLARQLRPDLVMLDIRMPELDGIAVAEAVSRAEIAPVVMITAHSDPLTVARSMEAEVYAFLTKPVKECDIDAAIRTALARFSQLRALRAEVRALRQDSEDRRLLKHARSLLVRALGITDAEAFRRLQAQSLKTQKPLREVAQAIVLAYGALSLAPPREAPEP